MGFPLTLIAKGIIYAVENFPRTNWTVPSVREETKNALGRFVGFTMMGLAGFGATFGFLASVAINGLLFTLLAIGGIALLFAGLFGLAMGIIRLGEIIKNRERRPNILVEMFKAKKNKHCPLVQWE